MKLLGTYKSNLQSFHYQELLTLLKEAIRVGELSGSKSFSDDQVSALISQAEDFSTLPLPEAGQRVTDDVFNTPLNLLEARFTALINEANDFISRSSALVQVIEKDTSLLDQILSAASLEEWVSKQSPLYNAKTIAWDYGMGISKVTTEISPIDPANGVGYSFDGTVESNFDTNTGTFSEGVTFNQTSREISIKNMSWAYQTNGQKEELYGTDWTKLSLLEDRPLLYFPISPNMDVLLPTKGSALGVFDVAGVSPGGVLPIYIRTSFHPRRSSVSLTPVNAVTALGDTFKISAGQRIYVSISAHNNGADGSLQLALSCQNSSGTEIKRMLLVPVTATQNVSGLITIPNDLAIAKGQLVIVLANNTVGSWTQTNVVVHLPQQLTSYSVNPDSVNVYTIKDIDTPDHVFFQNQDYITDDQGLLTFMSMVDGVQVTARFTELYPAYQCSVNNNDWSPIVMFDVNRPHPDDEIDFTPIAVSNGRFPITDERGLATGISIKMIGRPVTDYLLLVSTPALPNYGATAVLEIELERPGFLNGLRLSPFTTWPAKVTTIETEDFSADTRQTLWTGGTVAIDKPTIIRFPRRIARKIYLTFYQESYSLKEHTVNTGDNLRREILANLQSVLPLSARRLERSTPNRYRGAQYEFGLENLIGLDTVENSTVFVTGPYNIVGCPEVIKVDASMKGSVDLYLCFRAYGAGGVEIDVQLQGIHVVPGTTMVFPFSNLLVRSTVKSTKLYIKVVPRTALSALQKLLLQVTTV